MLLRMIPAMLLVGLVPVAARGLVYTAPNSLFNGSANMEVQSGLTALDGPRIIPYPNSSSYDGWWWDVVSTSSVNESIIISPIFNGPSFVSPPGYSLPIGTQVIGTFANGTRFAYELSADSSANVTIMTSGNSSFGGFGNGVSWESNRLGSVVHLEIPSYGISGTVTLNSVAPAHYFCSLQKPNASEITVPGMGWVNPIPDANGAVDITIGSEKLSFTGHGYEDKIWGDSPFVDHVQTWYWGHGRLGPYSVVWYDMRTIDGAEIVSSYVTHKGRVISAGCEDGGVKVRPYGSDCTYPPQPRLSDPAGFTADFDLGSDGFLRANVTITLSVHSLPTYVRYIGTISGGIEGGEQYSGKALFEQLR